MKIKNCYLFNELYVHIGEFDIKDFIRCIKN